jgi:drug/metabolite transporter (DMT)-like permease
MNSRKQILPWIILFALVLAWGSSFILMKRGLESFSSSEVAAIRISSAFLFLLPFGYRHFRNIPADKWKYVALSGFIGYFIPAFLFTKAQTHIDSSISGILNSATPLFTLIIGLSFYNFRARWYNVAGVFMGLVGAVGLLYFSGKGSISLNIGFGLLVILATILYALNINIIKSNLKDVNATSLSVFIFLIIGPFALIYLLMFTDFIPHLSASGMAVQSLAYIIILGVICSALATIIYNRLIKISGILFAASVTYVMPVIAIIWGILDGEIFRVIYIGFIILILTGVFLVNYTVDERRKA